MKDFKTKNGFFTGNVGIGTASPTSKLDVVDNDNSIQLSVRGRSSDSFGIIDFKNNAGTASKGMIKSDASNNLMFRAGPTNDVLTMTSGGNVGIGTTSPNAKLDVKSFGSGKIVQRFQTDNGSSYSIMHIGGGGASDIKFSVNGGGDVFASGNVGIGTTSPARLLHLKNSNSSIAFETPIDANGSAYAQIKSGRDGSSGYSSTLEFATTESTTAVGTFGSNGTGGSGFATRMLIDSAGNVGIGTTSPGVKLEVKGASSSFSTDGEIISVQTATANHRLALGVNSDEEYAWIRSSKAGTELPLILNNTYPVGIGVTNPGAFDSEANQLVVRGNTHGGITIFAGTNASRGNLYFSDGVVGNQAYVGGITYDHGDDDLSLRTNGTEKVWIKGDGNVGIGTSTPYAQLQVSNSTAGIYQFQVKSEHTNSGWGGLSSFVQVNGSLSRSLIVGAYRPQTNVNPCGIVQFQSRDGGSAFLWLDDSNVLRLGDNSSNIGSTNGTSLGTAGTSDERLKNIEDDFEYGLSHVLQLKPIAFTFKKDAQQVRKLGFGAQTSQSIIPESVYDSGNCIDGYDAHPEHEGMNVAKSDDNELGMEYVQLIPVLAKAIQEQQSIIKDLKSQNKSLAERISALES